MVKVFCYICSMRQSPTLEIVYDANSDSWSCIAYYNKDDKHIRLDVPVKVKKVLSGDALESFFSNKVERDDYGILPVTDESTYTIQINTELKRRRIWGSSHELTQFCQIEPLSKLSDTARKVFDNLYCRQTFIDSCTGKEPFLFENSPLSTPATLQDFWRFQFSNIWNLTSDLAEYIVAHALGKERASNRNYWSLWDINYRNARIEVKSTAEYHCWTMPEDKPTPRIFGITPAHSGYKDTSTDYTRQSDIYVFCHNTGKTAEESKPNKLEKWNFYIVTTEEIDQQCRKGQKTISLKRVISLSKKCYMYNELRQAIDEIIPTIKKLKNNQ